MFHLLSMRAAATLARSAAVGDGAFAATCDDAFRRGQAAVELLLADSEHGGSARAVVTAGEPTVPKTTLCLADAHLLPHMPHVVALKRPFATLPGRPIVPHVAADSMAQDLLRQSHEMIFNY